MNSKLRAALQHLKLGVLQYMSLGVLLPTIACIPLLFSLYFTTTYSSLIAGKERLQSYSEAFSKPVVLDPQFCFDQELSEKNEAYCVTRNKMEYDWRQNTAYNVNLEELKALSKRDGLDLLERIHATKIVLTLALGGNDENKAALEESFLVLASSYELTKNTIKIVVATFAMFWLSILVLKVKAKRNPDSLRKAFGIDRAERKLEEIPVDGDQKTRLRFGKKVVLWSMFYSSKDRANFLFSDTLVPINIMLPIAAFLLVALPFLLTYLHPALL